MIELLKQWSREEWFHAVVAFLTVAAAFLLGAITIMVIDTGLDTLTYHQQVSACGCPSNQNTLTEVK